MIYLILVFQNQYIGPEPYTICVWFRYIYNLEISRAATPKQQTIFGVQVVYRSGLLDVMKRRTAFGHRRALDTAVSLLYHLSPTARGRRYSKDLLQWLSESQKEISGNYQYQQFVL
ncbi:Hypothetical_protein [Hexamita inflata]|uniref:Hypothetical_protein n=1 Tax=Hexamita inflata TaxID=28002 RepID=A0AA86P7I5_9EUKA|nr:Hypothetical protein HINF_LOCUS20773 [Hexamita inflata]